MKIYNFNSKRAFNRLTSLLMAAMAILMLAPLTACNDSFIYDDEEKCDYQFFVRFVFDMNMSYADAFPAKVNSVKLFVFDPVSGDLIKTYTDSGDALQEEGYRMKVDLDPGKYDFIAWCGLENNKDHFTLPESISHREHAHCRMARDYDENGRAVQRDWLTPLFHGRTEADFPDDFKEHVAIVHLIKDTNNINISMQHVAGQPLTRDMFTVSMTEGNGHMAFDNALLQDEEVDFYPWTITDGNVDISGSRADGDTPLNYFKAELSTSRLMADRNPRINITDNATGKVVYSIPIIEWALEFRSEKYSDMDKQEYLDREDQYNVMLYLDNKDEKGWIAAEIYINGWRVVHHDDTVMGH